MSTAGGALALNAARGLKRNARWRWWEGALLLVLLLSWVPLIGDAVCVAGGWLRLNPWWAVLFIALGKFGRYCVIAGLVA